MSCGCAWNFKQATHYHKTQMSTEFFQLVLFLICPVVFNFSLSIFFLHSKKEKSTNYIFRSCFDWIVFHSCWLSLGKVLFVIAQLHLYQFHCVTRFFLCVRLCVCQTCLWECVNVLLGSQQTFFWLDLKKFIISLSFLLFLLTLNVTLIDVLNDRKYGPCSGASFYNSNYFYPFVSVLYFISFCSVSSTLWPQIVPIVFLGCAIIYVLSLQPFFCAIVVVVAFIDIVSS